VIQRLDADGDGKVSREEFRGTPARFGVVDRNGDGFLTLEELRAAPQGAASGPGTAQSSPQQGKKGGKSGARQACTFETAPPVADSPYQVDVYSPDCMFAGTTLFGDVSPNLYSSIVEVDFAGRVIWSTAPDRHIAMPKEARIMDVERLPSDNILFNVKQ